MGSSIATSLFLRFLSFLLCSWLSFLLVFTFFFDNFVPSFFLFTILVFFFQFLLPLFFTFTFDSFCRSEQLLFIFWLFSYFLRDLSICFHALTCYFLFRRHPNPF